MFQSLFYWITYSYLQPHSTKVLLYCCFNPYFIGLPILILYRYNREHFYYGFNPYFIGLPILIGPNTNLPVLEYSCFNPYFIGLPILIDQQDGVLLIVGAVSILILLDYLFLLYATIEEQLSWEGFNPYFIGLPILILQRLL